MLELLYFLVSIYIPPKSIHFSNMKETLILYIGDIAGVLGNTNPPKEYMNVQRIQAHSYCKAQHR